FRGRLPAEEGAVVMKALEAVRDRATAAAQASADEAVGVSAETRSAATRYADALVEVADRALARGAPDGAPRTGGDRYQAGVPGPAQPGRGWMPLSRLHEPPVGRRPSHRALGRRWRHLGRQPRPSVPPPPSPRP